MRPAAMAILLLAQVGPAGDSGQCQQRDDVGDIIDLVFAQVCFSPKWFAAERLKILEVQSRFANQRTDLPGLA